MMDLLREDLAAATMGHDERILPPCDHHWSVLEITITMTALHDTLTWNHAVAVPGHPYLEAFGRRLLDGFGRLRESTGQVGQSVLPSFSNDIT